MTNEEMHEMYEKQIRDMNPISRFFYTSKTWAVVSGVALFPLILFLWWLESLHERKITSRVKKEE